MKTADLFFDRDSPVTWIYSSFYAIILIPFTIDFPPSEALNDNDPISTIFFFLPRGVVWSYKCFRSGHSPLCKTQGNW